MTEKEEKMRNSTKTFFCVLFTGLFLSGSSQTLTSVSSNSDKTTYYHNYSEGSTSIIIYDNGVFEYENYIIGHKVHFSAGKWTIKDSIYTFNSRPKLSKRMFKKKNRPKGFRYARLDYEKYVLRGKQLIYLKER